MSEKRIDQLPLSDRPREKLINNGPSTLTNSELLALILRSGIRGKNVLQLAQEILIDFDFENLSRSSVGQLKKFNGIGAVKASQIVAVFELAHRLSHQQLQIGIQISRSEDVLDFIAPEMRRLEREELRVLHLNNSNEVLKVETLFKGSLDEMMVNPREIVRSCLKVNSKNVILVHNHPNGHSQPSQQDLTTTTEIETALVFIDVQLLDHIIIGKYNEYSVNQKSFL